MIGSAIVVALVVAHFWWRASGEPVIGGLVMIGLAGGLALSLVLFFWTRNRSSR
jgi:hypothetical protein